MRVLAVGAHPDDLEILCAGTLLRCVARGDEVVMCHATAGDKGSAVHTREEIARIRAGEARRAAEIAGATCVTLGFADGEVDRGDREQRAAVVDLIREHRPELIFTHDPSDYMSDHVQVAALVVECSFHATLRLFETGRPHHDVVAPIFHIDTLAGVGFEPTEYVDVTDVIEGKRAMLEAHRSQVEWLREHDGVDVVEDVMTVARYRGMQCGVRYAEGFRPYQAWLRRRPERLLP